MALDITLLKVVGDTELKSLFTPAHYATVTFCGLRDVVTVLSIGPQDVNSLNFNNESPPLHLASQEGRLDIARFLVEQGANAAAHTMVITKPLEAPAWRRD